MGSLSLRSLPYPQQGVPISICAAAKGLCLPVKPVAAAVQEMNSELKRQEKVLDGVTDHTDRSAYDLQNVSQQAKKDFKVKPGEPSHVSVNSPTHNTSAMCNESWPCLHERAMKYIQVNPESGCLAPKGILFEHAARF